MKYHENSFFTGIRDSEAGGTVRNAIAGIAERKSCRNGFERVKPSGRISPEYVPACEAAFRLGNGPADFKNLLRVLVEYVFRRFAAKMPPSPYQISTSCDIPEENVFRASALYRNRRFFQSNMG